MRQLILNNMITLDGFYADPKDDLSWHYADDEHLAYAAALGQRVDTFLFGRVTYELMAGYWPTAPKDPVADMMNGHRKVVCSRTLRHATWQNSTLVTGDVPQAIAALKQAPGKDIAIFGSGNLATTLVRHGLIDEYQLLLCPIFLGSGRSLLAGVEEWKRLKLVSTKTRKSGVVELVYRPS